MQGALTSGPESRFVVDALSSVLDGQGPAGRDELVAGAGATSWAAVLHRLDVAGRALVLDAGLTAADVPAAAVRVAALAATSGVDVLPSGTDAVLAAWSQGVGVPVDIDLTTGQVDAAPEADRAWSAALVLAWLIERSGYPPQVIA